MVRHWWLRAGGAFVTRGKDEGVTKPWREPVPLQGAAALTGHDVPTPATQRGGRGWGPGPGVPASWRGSFAKRVSSIQSTQGHLPRLKQVPGRPPHERLGPSAHKPRRFIGSSATPVPGPGFPIVTINLKSPLPMNKLWEQKCQGQQGLLIVIAPYGVTESSQD